MKKTLVTFAVASLVICALNVDAGDDQGGRYRLVMARTSDGSDRPYVFDTQTGRVWHQTLDVKKNALVFSSDSFENIDGELSKVPNETATDVVLKSELAKKAEINELEKKAEGGDNQSQYELGRRYMFGEGGFPVNNILALKWLLVAQIKGNEDAAKKITILTNFMSADDVAKAQVMANEFKPSSQ